MKDKTGHSALRPKHGRGYNWPKCRGKPMARVGEPDQAGGPRSKSVLARFRPVLICLAAAACIGLSWLPGLWTGAPLSSEGAEAPARLTPAERPDRAHIQAAPAPRDTARARQNEEEFEDGIARAILV